MRFEFIYFIIFGFFPIFFASHGDDDDVGNGDGDGDGDVGVVVF